MNDFTLMTERERLDAVLPTLWELTLSYDPDSNFTELQLASIAYTTTARAVAKWDPEGMPFQTYLRMRLEANLQRAVEAKAFSHSAELYLDALMETGA